MNFRIALLLALILIAWLFLSIRLIGFVTQSTTPSSVTIVDGEGAETPPPSTGSTGGGGGAIITTLGPVFIVNKDLIKTTIKQGETYREIIMVTNTGNDILTITVDSDLLGRFLAMSPRSFSIAPKETKEIVVDVFAKQTEVPDAYVGSIVFKGSDTKAFINVIVEVIEKEPLFDILVELERSEYAPGENVIAKITVTNSRDLALIDIMLHYAIRDFAGKIITFREESIALEQKLEVKRQLPIALNISSGSYVFYARASYKDITAASAEKFTVVDIGLAPYFADKRVIYVMIISLVVFAFIILLFLYWRRRQEEKEEHERNTRLIRQFQWTRNL